MNFARNYQKTKQKKPKTTNAKVGENEYIQGEKGILSTEAIHVAVESNQSSVKGRNTWLTLGD